MSLLTLRAFLWTSHRVQICCQLKCFMRLNLAPSKWKAHPDAASWMLDCLFAILQLWLATIEVQVGDASSRQAVCLALTPEQAVRNQLLQPVFCLFKAMLEERQLVCKGLPRNCGKPVSEQPCNATHSLHVHDKVTFNMTVNAFLL